MKKLLSFIIILLFFISKHSFSQERAVLNSLLTKPDSTKSDSLRASINQNIGFQYIHINSDSAAYFTNKAIQQYTRLSNPEGIINASFNLSRIYLQKSESDKAADVLLKLLPNLTKAKNKTLKGKCYNLLGEICRSAEDFKRALHFLNEANKISKQINNIELFAKNCNRTAAVYYEIKDYGLAITYADSALDASKKK